MATYYKYAERSADSQVNWVEVGKGISDMLSEEIKLRDEKKAAYEEAYRLDMEKLANAPQGKWQDGNATVNNFAHDMMSQQLIDNKLLKSGMMKERDYTLRRENYKTQTNTVFDLQKILQAERESTIDLFQKGELQALNISNMADVEAYTDFANSKIDIDPYAANINMSIYETKMVDGKEVRVLKKTSPVNVLKGQLLQKVPAFKLDETVNRDVESLGVDSDYIYKAASVMGAGSITKLIGYGAIAGEYSKKDKDGNPLYPEFADSIKKFDNAVEETINKYFSNPYNISSVLTENTGKYGAESYTWDNEEAQKDKTKILKKIDPLTGLPIMDPDAPHYKQQVQEAREYVKKTILGKLDAKREISVSPQLSQLREPSEAARAGKENESVISNIAKFYNGDDVAVKEAADFVRGLNPNIDTVDRTGDNIEITFNDGRAPEIIQWKAEDGSLIPIESWITANTNFFLPEGKRIADVNKIVARAGIDKNRTFNPESKGFSAGTVQEKEDVPTAFKRISQEKSGLEVSTFVADNEEETVKNLRSVIASLKGLEGFTLSEASPGYDVVELKDEKGNIVLEFDLNELDAEIAQGYVNQLLETASNRTKIEDQAIYVGKGRKQSEPQQRTLKRGEGPDSAAAQGGFNATQFKQQQTGG